jgi:CheY-like chemotaxis protein
MNKSRILVVDDEAIARDNLEHILRKDGYDVVTADSGIAALKKLSNTEFDLDKRAVSQYRGGDAHRLRHSEHRH